MFTNPLVRLGIGVPLAALIAVALFQLMEFLIRVEQACPPGQKLNAKTQECVKVNSRTLRNILAEENEIQNVRSNRKQPERLDKANKPPPPPKMSTSKQNVDLPKANISGAAPTEIKFDRVTNIDVGAVAVNDRDAQPIRPPNQGPLIRAIQRVGKSAECEVRLDVDPRGKPFNVDATCNIKSYERAAEQAVSAAEFAPKIIRGKPVGRKNVVYPIELRLED